MAGTFNSKNGYLTVDGLLVDTIVVGDKFSVDSDWVVSLITPAIEAMNLDSEVVAKIAKAVDLNDLIDSDAIYKIAGQAFADVNVDSDIIEAIAIAAQAQIQINITNLDSDVGYHANKIAEHDSDIGDIRSFYAGILSSDSVQNANIATNTADILTLSTRNSQRDSDVEEIEADVTMIYGRMTAVENLNTTVEARTTSLETAVGNTGAGGSHETRIAALETTIAALQAQIAALTLNDLTNVDLVSTAPVVGDVLEFNGTDFVPVATS